MTCFQKMKMKNLFSVVNLLVASDNELWIGAESGIYIYNLPDGQVCPFAQFDQ